MPEFTDRVIIVTGASEGIGRALCVALAPQGPRLVLAARNRERLGSLKAEVESLGARALVVPTDVTIEAECRSLVEKTVADRGAIDALVANAGGTMWARLDEVTDTGIFERLMRLNYLGAAWCTYYALPHLKKSKGRIVAISSAAGLTGVPTRTGYAASKHAMMGFFDSLRIELFGTGVTVTIVAPYFVVSEIHRRALGPDGKPLGTSPMVESKVMTTAACAQKIVRAMERRDRLLVTSKRARLGMFIKLFSPETVDKMAKKAIEKRH
ncbi:MAG: SDR family oxidoreductase [Deltaproteobacteria bacterium]|nr:SDR family oxidoreductase [Deltaproteobacteria bacterium]